MPLWTVFVTPVPTENPDDAQHWNTIIKAGSSELALAHAVHLHHKDIIADVVDWQDNIDPNELPIPVFRGDCSFTLADWHREPTCASTVVWYGEHEAYSLLVSEATIDKA